MKIVSGLLAYGDDLASLMRRQQDLDDQLDDHESGENELSSREEALVRKEWAEIDAKIRELKKKKTASKLTSEFKDMAGGKEVLLMTETEDTLILTYSAGAVFKNKGPGGEEAQMVDYVVTYNGDTLARFELNGATGDVVANSVKLGDKLDIANFFSQLTQNLIINGASSLKSK